MIIAARKSMSCMGLKVKQSGLALVESVIAIPLVIVIMLGVAELGNAILQYNALTQFVRDGARYGSAHATQGSGNIFVLDGVTISEITNIVVYGRITAGSPLLQGLNPDNVTVTNMGNGNISVQANFDYQPLLIGGIPDLIRGGSIGGAFTLRAQAIMRVLT
jgi:Flp pilus assembly protein TadG